MYILIDGYSLGYQVWHASPINKFESLPDNQENLDDSIVGFVYSFCVKLSEIVKSIDMIDGVFSKTFIFWDGINATKLRKEVYPNYKESRKLKRDQRSFINPQKFINLLKKGLNLASTRLNISDEFAEADDLIAIMCDILKDEKKIVVSRDRDLFQLIDRTTLIFDPLSFECYNIEKSKKLIPVSPDLLLSYKSLVGDPSDNYPGVSGVGRKTAIELLTGNMTIKSEKFLNFESREDFKMFQRIASIPFDLYDDNNFLRLLDSCLDEDEGIDWSNLTSYFLFDKSFLPIIEVVT